MGRSGVGIAEPTPACGSSGDPERNLRMREFENAGVGNTLSLEDYRFPLEGGV